MKRVRAFPHTMSSPSRRRAGAATLDYVLVLGVLLVISSYIVGTGRRMIQLTYEMIHVMISWPFL